jgi:hypothetical protein
MISRKLSKPSPGNGSDYLSARHKILDALTLPHHNIVGESRWNILQGYQDMNMAREGQMCNVEKGDIMDQLAMKASLFGVTT